MHSMYGGVGGATDSFLQIRRSGTSDISAARRGEGGGRSDEVE